MEETQVWLEALLKGIVEFPEDVSVNFEADNMGVLFTAHVNPKDAGKLIGREGKTAKAIRALLYSKGFMHDLRASLKLDVPELADRA